MERHLIITSSFFPSVGGAQGSLINFTKILGEKNCYIVLGLKSYIWSLNKKKRFRTFPTIFNILKKSKFLTKLYLTILIILIKPGKIWLYGGGDIAATILRSKVKGCFKYILRPAGEDIQTFSDYKYGLRLNRKKKDLIEKYYKNADLFWSLNKNIKKILISDFNINKKKIFTLPNYVLKPKIKKKKAKYLRIGIIGRNNPKKQLALALSIADKCANNKIRFYFKTPGFNFKSTKYIKKIKETKINSLTEWPPKDVWKFHSNIDILLVTSIAEGFPNALLETHLMGNAVIVYRKMPGVDILKRHKVMTFFYNSFDKTEISNKILNLSKKFKNKEYKNLNNIGEKKIVEILNKLNEK